MDRETRNALAATHRGLLHLGGKALVVRSPSDADFAFIAGELRRLAKAKARSPLAALAEEFAALPPAMRELAVEKAVAQKSGGDSEPTQEQVGAQLYTAEGCRAWVWWLARTEQEITLDDLAPLITEANVVEVLAELARATGLGRAFPNSNGPASSKAGSQATGPGSTAG